MSIFSGFTQETHRKTVIDLLIKESRVNMGYFFLLSIASLITTMGLSLNNVAVIIGGMMIAPLLTPILALGLGITTVSIHSILRSFQGIVTSIFIVIFWSFVTSMLIHNVNNYLNPEIASRGEYSILYLVIAILSGLGATYAWIEPMIASSLPGVAVAVSLVPPLCVTGIALAQANRQLMFDSFILFLVNVVGMVLASIVVFIIFRFGKFKQFTEKQVEKVAASE